MSRTNHSLSYTALRPGNLLLSLSIVPTIFCQTIREALKLFIAGLLCQGKGIASFLFTSITIIVAADVLIICTILCPPTFLDSDGPATPGNIEVRLRNIILLILDTLSDIGAMHDNWISVLQYIHWKVSTLFVPFQCIISGESFLTDGAGDDRRKPVQLQVNFKILCLFEILLADCAPKDCVYERIVFQKTRMQQTCGQAESIQPSGTFSCGWKVEPRCLL